LSIYFDEEHFAESEMALKTNDSTGVVKQLVLVDYIHGDY
jgi:hypothetical protein